MVTFSRLSVKVGKSRSSASSLSFPLDTPPSPPYIDTCLTLIKEASVMELFILILEIVGTVSFALSGAMTGLKKNMDIFGVCVLGVTTAVGGGILRDLLLGLTPPLFWIPNMC